MASCSPTKKGRHPMGHLMADDDTLGGFVIHAADLRGGVDGKGTEKG
jgi:hypothetical protein